MPPPTALITGGSRGLGFATAKSLALEHGYHVVVTGRDASHAQRAAEEIRAAGGSVSSAGVDVTSPGSVTELRRWFQTSHGDRLDALVNCAGVFVLDRALDADLDKAAEVLATNFWGPWRVSQAFADLLPSGGCVINVSSRSGAFESDEPFGLRNQGPDACSYGVSKAALNALTVKLAEELRGRGVRVNAVCPGLTATREEYAKRGGRPVAEGAKGIVWAVLGGGADAAEDEPEPEPEPEKRVEGVAGTTAAAAATGGFWRDGKRIAW